MQNSIMTESSLIAAALVGSAVAQASTADFTSQSLFTSAPVASQEGFSRSAAQIGREPLHLNDWIFDSSNWVIDPQAGTAQNYFLHSPTNQVWKGVREASASEIILVAANTFVGDEKRVTLSSSDSRIHGETNLNKNSPPSADTIFWNGPIYPMQSGGSTSTVESLVVKGEKIIFVGSREEAKSYIGKETQVVDLKGRAVFPGFTDAHTHPLARVMINSVCDISSHTELGAITEAIRKYSESNPAKQWIVAMGAWEPAFQKLTLTPREALDQIVSDRPLSVLVASGHVAWLNSKALELSAITADTPDPEHGKIGRNVGSQVPNGSVYESAISIVLGKVPPPLEEDKVRALSQSINEANSFGIVNLIDARIEDGDIAVYRRLAATGDLHAEVSLAAFADISRGTNCVGPVVELIRRHRTDLPEQIKLNQVKLYLDGTVEGKTAAMLDSFVGETNRSLGLTDPDTAKAVIAAFDREGLQVHVHAIGDRGIRMALDGFEFARQKNGARDSRHQIAHLHVVHPDDLPRFKSLDVVANFQACWADGDSEYNTKINFGLLGALRAQWQYAMGTLDRSGATLVFGSDWPVSSMDPLRAIQIAVTRRQPDGIERPAWTPQHLIELKSVLEGFTRTGAWVTFNESVAGTLEAGKLANLVVLDCDITKVSKYDILRKGTVQKTMYRGDFVFERK